MKFHGIASVLAKRSLLVSGLTFACAIVAIRHEAHADADDLTVRIIPPERLTAGDHTEVVVEVSARATQAQPLILTPTSEGDAIEVVRGRFLRSDATVALPDDGMLRFRVPIVAQSSGTSVFRVRVTSYVCTTRCRAVDADSFVVLRAIPRTP